jgi:threonine/homoserine efflux transporter RhtA
VTIADWFLLTTLSIAVATVIFLSLYAPKGRSTAVVTLAFGLLLGVVNYGTRYLFFRYGLFVSITSIFSRPFTGGIALGMFSYGCVEWLMSARNSNRKP